MPPALFRSGLTQGSILHRFFSHQESLYLAPRAFYTATLATLSPTLLMDRFASPCKISLFESEFLIFTRKVGHTFSAELCRTHFCRTLQIKNGLFPKKLQLSEDTAFCAEEPLDIIA